MCNEQYPNVNKPSTRIQILRVGNFNGLVKLRFVFTGKWRLLEGHEVRVH